MTTTSAPPTKTPDDTTQEGLGARALRALLTQRIALLAVLIVVVVVWFFVLDAGGYLTASYNFDYMSASLINAVPLAMLGLAELLVILSGRGGIDLSVGAIVSLSGMVFGFAYGEWGWPLWLAIVVTALSGALLGAVNGFLVAYVGFPALIATLATFYAYKSLAIVINDQSPISTPPIQQLFSITRSVELPLFGQYVPDVPLGLFTFLLPTVVVVWVLLARTTYGRRLYGIGTNDVAARWAGLPVRGTRFKAYTYAGLISGFVAVVTVAQFASARPDAGVSGNGMALPAITIAVLGGVAITGGIGRVAGVVLATLLIVWLNAGILLAFVGNEGSQYQLLALGAVLVFAALLNGLTTRRYGGTLTPLIKSTRGPDRAGRLHDRSAELGVRQLGHPVQGVRGARGAAQPVREDRGRGAGAGRDGPGAAGLAAHPVGPGRGLRRARHARQGARRADRGDQLEPVPGGRLQARLAHPRRRSGCGRRRWRITWSASR